MDVILLHSGVIAGMKTFEGLYDMGYVRCNLMFVSLTKRCLYICIYGNFRHTLVHETGHWLGLRHTVTDSCDETDFAYDFRDDTPATIRADTSCDAKPVSCPDQNPRGTLEPVKNFMGYAMVACRSEFTESQVESMHYAFDTYRIRNATSGSDTDEEY
jgi:hypothetical protein